MKLIRGLHNLSGISSACVATIGNFDGVHLGHQRLFKHLLDSADAHGLPSCVITFSPLPHEYFAPPDLVKARLTRLREKYTLIRDYGIDQFLLLGFNRQLANLSADEFVDRILVDGLGIKDLIVGDDFRFGRKRLGDFDCLLRHGQAKDFTVRPTPTVELGGKRVSSTRIRHHLENGELSQAAELLGRPYHMEGRVVYGRQLGRQLGYPTANILLKRRKTPLHGIFVVRVIDQHGNTYAAMASLGERPTIGAGDTLLEVHLFDFQGNLYGQHLKVEFLQWLRAEQKFDSLAALTAAIQQDEHNARTYFQRNPL